MAEHPEIDEIEWIDDTFRVEKKKWGTWTTYLKDGKELVTGLERENTIRSTRWYLKCLQDGFPEPSSTHEGVVGGKL